MAPSCCASSRQRVRPLLQVGYLLTPRPTAVAIGATDRIALGRSHRRGQDPRAWPARGIDALVALPALSLDRWQQWLHHEAQPTGAQAQQRQPPGRLQQRHQRQQPAASRPPARPHRLRTERLTLGGRRFIPGRGPAAARRHPQ